MPKILDKQRLEFWIEVLTEARESKRPDVADWAEQQMGWDQSYTEFAAAAAGEGKD